MDDKEILRQKEFQRRKAESERLCEQLIRELKSNEDDAHSFFGGEIYTAYVKTTDMAVEKTKNIHSKIRNL